MKTRTVCVCVCVCVCVLHYQLGGYAPIASDRLRYAQCQVMLSGEGWLQLSYLDIIYDCLNMIFSTQDINTHTTCIKLQMPGTCDACT